MRVAYAFSAVILLASALRLYGIADRSFWKDEGIETTMAQFTGPPCKLLSPDFLNDPPLFPAIVQGWQEAVGKLPGVEPGTARRDGALRLLPALFGLLGVWAFYAAARRIPGVADTALPAALLMAVSPFHLYYAQDLRAYTLLVLLLSLGLLALLRALESNALRDWAAFTLCMVLAFYTQYAAVWYLAAFNLFFVLTLRQQTSRFAPWFAANATWLVAALPGLHMSSTISRTFEQATERWFPYPDWRMAVITFKNFSAGYSPHPSVYWPLFGLCAGLAFWGIYALRRQPRALALLLTWMLFPVVANALFANARNFPYYTHRLMIGASLPYFLLAAHGWLSLPRRTLRAGAAAGLLLLTMPCWNDYYRQHLHPVWRHTCGALYKPDNRNAARAIAADLQPGDYVAHTSHHTLAAFRYYLDVRQSTACVTPEERLDIARGYPRPVIYETNRLLPLTLPEIVGQARRVWLVKSSYNPFMSDPQSDRIQAWVAKRWRCAKALTFDGVQVFLFTPPGPTAIPGPG